MIHPTAIIDEGAEIGEGTKVWHFSHVMPGARIGDRVHIQNNVSVYEGVELEDEVFCGPSCVFTNVKNPRSEFPRKDELQKTRVLRGATIGANATLVCGVTIGRWASSQQEQWSRTMYITL
jgi:UDP-2-acetamido-3-amino-2,3-dideoxy-glucuronate N-acetyltransferase